MERTLQVLNTLERDGIVRRYAIGGAMAATFYAEPVLDPLRPEIARLLAAKEQRRRQLAALPFPQKVRLVVQLQQMVAPILRARGRSIRVWHLDTGPPL